MADIVTSPDEIKDYQNPYLGYLVDSLGVSKRLRYKGEKSLLCIGSSGANKSTGLLIPNLAMLRRSMIVIDPKGQLCAISANKRRKMGRVIILNPFDELLDVRPDLESTGWNPLAQLDPESDDFASDARSIAEAMIEKGNGKGEFFETSMENLWAVFCMWERLQKGERASLCDVRETLAELTGDDAEMLAALSKMRESKIRAIRIAAKRLYKRLTDKKSQTTSIQDVVETVMKNTAFLDDPRIEYDMKARTENGVKFGGAIPFDKMHEEIITVYVVIPLGQLKKQGKWVRMFVKLAFAALFRSPPREEKLPRVLFALDEFGNLGRIPEVLEALNVARDYRIQCWFFLQYLHQLKTAYPDEWPAFFSGSGAISCFNAHDPETAEFFSKMLGKREEYVTSWSISNNQGVSQGNNPNGPRDNISQGFGNGKSVSLQVTNLMDPDQLRRIGKARTINFIEPCGYPIRGIAPGYWDLFEPGQLDPNPYYLTKPKVAAAVASIAAEQTV